MDIDISQLRRNYTQDGLSRKDLREDPFAQFKLWFGQAVEAQLLEPNAMTLATSTSGGHPTQRTVLLKNFDERGFVFFTNYGSKKAQQIEDHPRVSILFPWIALERQVIVTGTAHKIPRAETLKYFLTRPLESQLGAWASTQSGVISSKKVLQMKFAEVKAKFKDGKVPLPSAWGGYCVTPLSIEFWQGGAGRLHDRFLYSRESGEDDEWKIERLAP
ncbi:MAG: pyridoxamine 5'-phosphate oxidase [Verrucomicrobiales bacterium]|jgi:pyridoxamine 5'-phosphate oxidase